MNFLVEVILISFVSIMFFGIIMGCNKEIVPIVVKKPVKVKQDDLKVREGWQDNDTYLAYGTAKPEANAANMNETKAESCKRRAVFNAKSSIIPAFMSNPKAKPSYDLKQKMAFLLKIIEHAEVEDFKLDNGGASCRVLIKIKHEGLRFTVEEVR